MTFRMIRALLKYSFLISLCCCNQVLAQPQEELKYTLNGSNNWVPYYIQHSENKPGIIGELIPLVLSDANIQGRVVELPPRRTNQGLNKGLLDFDVVSPSWFENEFLGDNFVQSIPLIPIKEYVITLKSNTHIWEQKDIKGEIIGTVMGYIYSSDKTFTRADFGSEKALIKALNKGRIQAAIIGDLPALYWAQQLNIDIGLADVYSDGNLVIRLTKQNIALLPALNQSIERLQKNGTLDKIIAKYAHYNLAK